MTENNVQLTEILLQAKKQSPVESFENVLVDESVLNE